MLAADRDRARRHRTLAQAAGARRDGERDSAAAVRVRREASSARWWTPDSVRTSSPSASMRPWHAKFVARSRELLHLETVRWSFDSLHLVESRTHPDGVVATALRAHARNRNERANPAHTAGPKIGYWINETDSHAPIRNAIISARKHRESLRNGALIEVSLCDNSRLIQPAGNHIEWKKIARRRSTAALGQIEKQFGKGSVMRLGDAAAAPTTWKPSPPVRSASTSRWASAACRADVSSRSTGRSLPVRPRSPFR